VKGRWRELLSTLADVCTVVPILVLLAAWVGYAVGGLSGPRLALVVVVALAALAAVGWWRRRTWWRVVRPKYVSAVVWLARCVGRDVVERLRGEGATREELLAGVTDLTQMAAEVLRRVLAGYEPRGDGWVVIRPVDKRLRDREKRLTKGYVNDLVLACDELQRGGFVSRVEVLEGDAWVRVLLSGAVRNGLVLKVEERVTEHLAGYGIYPGSVGFRVWGIVAEPAVPAEEGEGE